jgi:hypothetical protein
LILEPANGARSFDATEDGSSSTALVNLVAPSIGSSRYSARARKGPISPSMASRLDRVIPPRHVLEVREEREDVLDRPSDRHGVLELHGSSPSG